MAERRRNQRVSTRADRKKRRRRRASLNKVKSMKLAVMMLSTLARAMIMCVSMGHYLSKIIGAGEFDGRET